MQTTGVIRKVVIFLLTRGGWPGFLGYLLFYWAYFLVIYPLYTVGWHLIRWQNPKREGWLTLGFFFYGWIYLFAMVLHLLLGKMSLGLIRERMILALSNSDQSKAEDV